MIEQHVTLPKLDWDVCIFYDATPRHSSVIMRELWRCGIPAEKYWEAEHLLTSGRRNEGLTFTNPHTRQSVMVIGRTSSASQLVNTVGHESFHLICHICKADNIPLMGEDAACVQGILFEYIFNDFSDVVKALYSSAKRYISEGIIEI